MRGRQAAVPGSAPVPGAGGGAARGAAHGTEPQRARKLVIVASPVPGVVGDPHGLVCSRGTRGTRRVCVFFYFYFLFYLLAC